MSWEAVDGDEDPARLLVIEPLYGGAHKKLLDVVLKMIPKERYSLFTMTPKKWHWRARTSAMYMAHTIPHKHNYEVLFCSSVLPLTELIGLRPDLGALYKIVFFHENHLKMSVHASKDLNYELGYKEIMTCLAADQVLFNSHHNKDSFIESVNDHMRKQPDFTLYNMDKKIERKSDVVYFPIDIQGIDKYLRNVEKLPNAELYIVWPHRWEFDRAPEMLYRVILRLHSAGYNFRVVMFPESFMDKPTSPEVLVDHFRTPHLLHLENPENNPYSYYTILKRADVIVSTAKHEFFSPTLMEGIYCGLIPVLPQSPFYKEIFNENVTEIYEDEDVLFHILADLCRRKHAGVLNKNYKHLIQPYESNKWFERFLEIVQCQLG